MAGGLACWLCGNVAFSQQVPDSSYSPRVPRPEYEAGRGPVILVDAAHNNFHTVGGQFLAFSRLARTDGYQVRALNESPTRERLAECALLVIASPRHSNTLRSRARPIQDAYAAAEIAVLRDWVMSGGSLLLIADHMPVVGSMKGLLEAFGFHALDGFATTIADTTARIPIVFRRSDGTLRDHPITNGRSRGERVDSIATFTGAAFEPGRSFDTLWRLPSQTVVIVPDEPWVFPPSAPRIRGDGLSQGAARKVGRGQVVFAAEAAMFTAQWEGEGRTPMGLNHPAAAQNSQFVLNVLHWLTASSRAPAAPPRVPQTVDTPRVSRM